MDVSDLRQRILRALDAARAEAATRRTETDAAQEAYGRFLRDVAVPLLRQTQAVLKAEGHMFTVYAPAGSARLAADGHPDSFLEFALDTTGDRPQIVIRTSLARGGKRVIIDERPLSPGKPVVDIGEQDVAALLVSEIPKFVR